MYWGRKLRIRFYRPEQGTTTAIVYDVDTLNNKRGFKIDGVVTKEGWSMPPTAEVNFYNLSSQQVADIVSLRYKQEADGSYSETPLAMQIEAGYANGSFGTIFNGQVLKPTMQKPDPNNTMLKIIAIQSYSLLADNSSLTTTFNEGINYYQIAEDLLKQGLGENTDISYVISSELKNYTVDGSFQAGNSLYKVLNGIKQATGFEYSISGNNIRIDTLTNLFSGNQTVYVLNSGTGMINIPSLGTDGVSATSLLNHKLDILGLVKLNNGDISLQQKDYLPNREYGAWLDEDGIYVINYLTHNFDSTTGAFQTNIRCLSKDYLTYLVASNTTEESNG